MSLPVQRNTRMSICHLFQNNLIFFNLHENRKTSTLGESIPTKKEKVRCLFIILLKVSFKCFYLSLKKLVFLLQAKSEIKELISRITTIFDPAILNQHFKLSQIKTICSV